LLVTHLRALTQGHSVDRPVYDFVTHRRQAETIRVTPEAFVIVDGLLTFHWAETQELCHQRIFLDAPSALRLSRRVARDTVARDHHKVSVREQWAGTAQPMSTRYVKPTRGFADATIDTRPPVAHIVASVTERFGW